MYVHACAHFLKLSPRHTHIHSMHVSQRYPQYRLQSNHPITCTWHLLHSYEAWIIYNFTSLLLAYVGGPGAVVVKAEGKVVHPSWTHLTCCLPAMQVRVSRWWQRVADDDW